MEFSTGGGLSQSARQLLSGIFSSICALVPQSFAIRVVLCPSVAELVAECFAGVVE